jgi:serine/threonine-protein kinase
MKRFLFAPADLFSTIDDMTREVAAELNLPTAAAPKLPRQAIQNPLAFMLCLKGRFFWSRRYKGGLLKAAKCFSEALALDRGLAFAHAGIADTYSFLAFFSLSHPREAYAEAEIHAREALRLDPSLADAHTSLGLVKLGGDWDWDGAIAEFHEAVRLDPSRNTALARCYLSWTHVLRGEIAEAYHEAERAQDLDPASPMLNAAAGHTFFLSGAYERAIRECETALLIDENFLFARYVMALCKGQLGFHAEAIRDLERVVESSAGMVFYLALLGKLYAESGEKAQIAKAKAILRKFEKMRRLREQGKADEYVAPHAFVHIYAGLGDLDAAFEWQAKAFDDGASPFNYLSPQLSILHNDPRFLRDLRRWSIDAPGSDAVKTGTTPATVPPGRVQLA